jgi:hypothetical protein
LAINSLPVLSMIGPFQMLNVPTFRSFHSPRALRVFRHVMAMDYDVNRAFFTLHQADVLPAHLPSSAPPTALT